MTRKADRVIWFYIHLLRLYPPLFRAEFAAEMRDVFALAFNEAKRQGHFALIRLCLSELYDLPLSLVREHLRERRHRQLALFPEGMMFRWVYSPKLFRFCAVSALIISVLYLLSIVSAFFAFDLQTHSLNNLDAWYWQVADNPAFIGRQIPIIGLLAFVVYILVMPWMIVSSSVLGLNLWRHGYRLERWQLGLGVIALSVAIITVISLNTPLSYIGSLWFFD